MPSGRESKIRQYIEKALHGDLEDTHSTSGALQQLHASKWVYYFSSMKIICPLLPLKCMPGKDLCCQSSGTMWHHYLDPTSLHV